MQATESALGPTGRWGRLTDKGRPRGVQEIGIKDPGRALSHLRMPPTSAWVAAVAQVSEIHGRRGGYSIGALEFPVTFPNLE